MAGIIEQQQQQALDAAELAKFRLMQQQFKEQQQQLREKELAKQAADWGREQGMAEAFVAREAMRRNYMAPEEGYYNMHPSVASNPDGSMAYGSEWVQTKPKAPMAVGWGEDLGNPRRNVIKDDQYLDFPEHYR